MLEGLISLTNGQMDLVARTAGPLDPSNRARFLVDMARALRGQAIDDEAVARACAEARNAAP